MPPPAEGIASRFVLGPALRTQPDRRLVNLVREGYESAFEEIVRRYGKPLGRYAAAIVGGRSEDVTQDAFSKALLALRRDDAEIELRPWLFRIVRNTALNDLRDRPPEPEVLAEAIAGGRSAAEEVEQREELADLIERLQALPKPQRAAIVMRELEGLSHEEIAAALGLSGGGARQAIYRARQALRDGVGMLLPLPLLKAMLAGAGSNALETAAGVGGAGVALKATAATVLVAGAVGAGVAIDHGPRPDRVDAFAPPGQGRAAAQRPATISASAGDREDVSTPVGGSREREPGFDHGFGEGDRHGPGGSSDSSGSGRRGSGGSGERGLAHTDRSGRDDSPGGEDGRDGTGILARDNSGPGGGGAAGDGSDSSGSSPGESEGGGSLSSGPGPGGDGEASLDGGGGGGGSSGSGGSDGTDGSSGPGGDGGEAISGDSGDSSRDFSGGDGLTN